MIPTLAGITNEISKLVAVEKSVLDRFNSLKEGVPGWSELGHFLFFRELLKAKPNARVLVCGVYHGLDLRLLAGIANDLGQKPELVGIDLFSDGPMADWPERFRGKTWQEALGKPPPDLDAAKRNCPTASIFKGDSVAWMKHQVYSFDAIFLDTAHTPAQVAAEIEAGARILAPGGILCGDDYLGWNIESTIQERLPQHVVLFNRIWVARLP